MIGRGACPSRTTSRLDRDYHPGERHDGLPDARGGSLHRALRRHDKRQFYGANRGGAATSLCEGLGRLPWCPGSGAGPCSCRESRSAEGGVRGRGAVVSYDRAARAVVVQSRPSRSASPSGGAPAAVLELALHDRQVLAPPRPPERTDTTHARGRCGDGVPSANPRRGREASRNGCASSFSVWGRQSARSALARRGFAG